MSHSIARKLLPLAVLVAALCPAMAFAATGETELTVADVGIATQAQAAIDEAEPNDEFDEATAIGMNQWVYGISDEDRDDYYQVNIPQSGSVKIVFTNDKYSSGSWFRIYVYNQYYEETDVYTVGTSTTRPDSTLVKMKKGINRLIVEPHLMYAGHPYHFKLTYSIPATSITKFAPAKKSFTVKWTKKSGAAKYQVRYSTAKSMSKAKTVNVSKSTNKKKITKLKAKKKYWVQVRVAKTIGGETYWSSWSSKKAVKTK